jgi:DNA polymerase-3 subunit gamma/tau
VTLEAALVRLCSPEADTSVAALLERVDRLERRIAAGVPTEAGAAPQAQVEPPQAASPPAAEDADATRATLGAFRRKAGPKPSANPSASTSPATAEPSPPASAGAATAPDRDEITKAWGDTLLAALSPAARSVFKAGRWVSVDGQTAVFAVPNSFYLERAEAKRRDVEDALVAFFGVRVAVRLVEEVGAGAPPLSEDEVTITASEVAEMTVAEPPVASSAEDRLKQAFPGTEEVPT